MKAKVFGAIAFAGLMLAGAAQAADLVRKAPPLPAPEVFSWTGFYIGVHGGGAWGTVESELPLNDLFLNPDLGAFPVSSHTVNGFLGGAQVGYNWQVHEWMVLGVEGQFSWADISGSSPCVLVFKCTTEVNWISSVAGRIGYTSNRTMLYAKLGVAWADTDHTFDLSIFPDVFSFSASETRTGFLFGAGIEHAFLPNWSAKIEYNFIDFNSDDVGFGLNDRFCNRMDIPSERCNGVVVNADVTQNIHLIKLGVNYRFRY